LIIGNKGVQYKCKKTYLPHNEDVNKVGVECNDEKCRETRGWKKKFGRNVATRTVHIAGIYVNI